MTGRPVAGRAAEPPGHAGDAPVPCPFAGLWGRAEAAVRRGLTRITDSPVAPYQSAAVRIALSFTWLAYLLREWGHRDELYGPGSPFSWNMARQLVTANHAFTALVWSDSRLWFETVYVVAIAASVMLLVGWRTRTASLLFMLGVLTLQNRNMVVGNGGDIVIHLLATYMVFVRCGQVWSLDARRARLVRQRDRRGDKAAGDAGDVTGIVMWFLLVAVLAAVTALGRLGVGWGLILWGFAAGQGLWWLVRRRAPGEPRTVLTMMGNVVHAGALLVIVGQVCLIYVISGLYKIQGPHWGDGTGMYYVFHVTAYTPWPELSHALGSNWLVVMLITYGTVIIEVAFPFTLLNRRAKNVTLALLVGMHIGIAVLLGLPFFALAMIAADAVFVPTAFLRWMGDRVVRLVPRRRAVAPAPPREAAAEVAYRKADQDHETSAPAAPPLGDHQ
ncbi:HTTM domain-containing protein [Streptomyces sp. NBC_00820]|uniref:HTTM domain-containing protein n=1 Tax=Streptomyces sp. NBC_00820 TaxID=2975842 RepID=UPI002ED3D74D|nr:HTTM domain-containing protein [Streptomyces sp. NBC_00820]